MIEVFGSVPDSDHAQLQYKKISGKNDVLIKTKNYLICEIYNLSTLLASNISHVANYKF